VVPGPFRFENCAIYLYRYMETKDEIANIPFVYKGWVFLLLLLLSIHVLK